MSPLSSRGGSIGDRLLMLELRHRNGDVVAMGYSWLEKAIYKPSEGCYCISAAGSPAAIFNAEARPGVQTFSRLLRHGVAWIQEFDQPAMLQAGRKRRWWSGSDLTERNKHLRGCGNLYINNLCELFT